MPFNSQFKENKGQTFYPFETISLAIKNITFLYLLIILSYSLCNITKYNFCPFCKLKTVKLFTLLEHNEKLCHAQEP